MKIVRELGTGLPFREIKEIYDKGNKIAISFREDTLLAYINTCVDSYGNGLLDYHESKIEYRGGFCSVGDGFGCGAGWFVVVDNVTRDKCGCLAELHPFVGEYADFYNTTTLYDGAKGRLYIADRVVEIIEQ